MRYEHDGLYPCQTAAEHEYTVRIKDTLVPAVSAAVCSHYAGVLETANTENTHKSILSGYTDTDLDENL